MQILRKQRVWFLLILLSLIAFLLLCFPLGDGVRQAMTRPVWTIGIYEGDTPLDIHPSARRPVPLFNEESMKDLKIRVMADPFLIREGGAWHLFFEVMGEKTEKGAIGHAASQDLVHWSYGGVVLDEPFHLSYPCVFRWENEIYMIPETSEIHSVRLYRAEAFPGRWQFVKTLIHADGISDPSIFRVNGKWWLYGGDISCRNLRLYLADDLAGPWREHPQSPILQGNPFFSRPAGRVIQWNGKILRFAQQDIPDYGKQVWAFEVPILSESQYAEKPARNTPLLEAAGGDAWNGQGMHHVDLREWADGKWVAAVDGFREERSVEILLNRVFCKCRKSSGCFFRGNDPSEPSPRR